MFASEVWRFVFHGKVFVVAFKVQDVADQDGAALAGCRSLLWLIFWVTVSTFSFTSIPDSCRNK